MAKKLLDDGQVKEINEEVKQIVKKARGNACIQSQKITFIAILVLFFLILVGVLPVVSR